MIAVSRRWAGAIAAVVMLTSACGSTVQYSARVGPEDSGLDELGPPGPDSGVDPGRKAGVAAIGPGSGDALGRGGSGDRSVASRTTSPGHGMGPRSPSFAPGSGPGFTRNEIFIGFGSASDADKFMGAAGVDSNVGDMRGYARAVVTDINSRGGVLNRKLSLVIHDYTTQDLFKNPSGAAQAACDRWINDSRVLAVISLPGFRVTDEVLGSCLSRNRIPYANHYERPDSFYDRFGPYVYAPVAPSTERAVRVLVDRLAATGYFAKWDYNTGRPGSLPVKIGILTNNAGYAKAFENEARKALARHGRSVASMYRFSGDLERAADQFNQAAVQFRRANVTHVISADLFINGTTKFWERQNYNPRYSLSTNVAPRAADPHEDRAAAKNQLVGAIGVGYSPSRDVTRRQMPHLGDAEKRCRAVMKNAGYDLSSSQAWNVMAATCDLFNFYVNTIKKGGLSPEGVQRGAQAVRSLSSAYTFRTSFPLGRGHGAAAVRDLAYREDCECMKYISANRGM